MNKTNFGKAKRNSGFAALFVVMIIGFLSVFFVTTSLSRGWLQAKSIAEAKVNTSVRLSALSCVNIARLKIHLDENSTQNIEGEYYVKNSYCKIDSVSTYSNRVFVQTSSVIGGDEIRINVELEANDLSIVSIQEF